MDFTVPADSLAAFRQDARSWVDAHLPELATWAEEQRVTGNYHTPELHRRLAEAGWLGAGWPKEYGGTDNSVGMAQAIQQEIAAAGVHSDGWATTLIVINTLRHVGTEEQKHEFIGGALRGEVIIVLGYTEPDSGSDVAAAKTWSWRASTDRLVVLIMPPDGRRGSGWQPRTPPGCDTRASCEASVCCTSPRCSRRQRPGARPGWARRGCRSAPA